MTHDLPATALRAPWGCLCLPAIGARVPARLARDDIRQRQLARFARAAVRCGLPLPPGAFSDLAHVVTAQWSAYLAQRYPTHTFDALAGAPVVEIDDHGLRVVIHAQSHLNAYQLQPVIAPLEAQAPGLGWFVESVLAQASAHGLQVYDMGMAGYMLEVFHGDLDDFSDAAYARAILREQGDTVPDGPIPAGTLEELRAQYGFWPSDLLAEVGGHAHLLGAWHEGQPKRRVLAARAAHRWLRTHREHPGAVVVDAALRLRRAFANDRDRAFLWQGQDDGTETLGAMCFLAWDSPELLFEAVQHWEENQYNGGMAVEAFARSGVLPAEASDTELQALVRSLRAYLHRWALLAQLLAHFPVWETSDAA
ncbi:MAG TPA: PRTRC system protein F [Ramlibacter sp.]|jgi:PRTRC genetic system protein F|nr:PRTRC system protein F [Ramlibacter sp.]